MIGYLRGRVLECTEGRVLIAAGGGDSVIGYSVAVPLTAVHLVGQVAEFFIYTHVREDALDLYGFSKPVEKDLFLTLMGVSGIGPKSALGILSKVDFAQLIQAIVEEDKDQLTRIPGIGKKTAERVVVELSEPVRKKWEAGFYGGDLSRQTASSGTGAVAAGPSSSVLLRDAREALIGLGYREQEVTPILKRVIESENGSRKVEDLIRLALQELR